MLNDYQRAILQEMGIPMVRAQQASDRQSKQAQSPVSEQAREQTSGARRDKAAALSHIQKLKSAYDQQQGSVAIEKSQMRDDIEQALTELGVLASPSAKWSVSGQSPIEIGDNTVSFNKQVASLKPQEKRLLWQAIIKLTV